MNTTKCFSIIGTNVCELSTEELNTLGIKYGLRIAGPVGSAFSETNLCEGFIITSVNGKLLTSVKDLEEALVKDEGVMIGGIYPDGTHDHYFTRGYTSVPSD